MNLTEILKWSSSTVDLAPRADSTPLVPQGVAAVLHQGESHTYEVSKDMWGDALTLSICSYEGNSSTIYLRLNQTSFATTYGLASPGSISEYSSNGTVRVVPPNQVSRGSHWSYQLGIGSSASFFAPGDNFYLVDTDFANALLVTSPLEQLEVSLLSGYQGIGDTDSIDILEDAEEALGIHNFTLGIVPSGSKMANLAQSYCAIQSNALLNENNADISGTTRGRVRLPRAQFLAKGLNKSSEYVAYIGLPAVQADYSGGTIFAPTRFVTKTSTSCQVVYNMSFCSDMAFAVPGNASSYTPEELSVFYDTVAQERYLNFSNSLQQINCNVSQDMLYSPIRGCNDCDQAYRDWLCTTTIPRCADMSNMAEYLVTRHPGESRNPVIDNIIRPGAYKEVLPCKELCYALVRNCPSSFGFGCPPNRMMSLSYGEHSGDGDITCSYPGAIYDENIAIWLGPSTLLVFVALMVHSVL